MLSFGAKIKTREHFTKMELIKKNRAKIMTVIMCSLTLLFGALTSMQSPSVSLSTSYKILAGEGQKNDYGYAYAKIIYDDENANKLAAQTYLGIWGTNFFGFSQFIPTCFDCKTGDFKKFSAKIDGMDGGGDVYLGDFGVYSNQKALHRFETAWINVYDNDTFSAGTYRPGADGFVFLPDFYADAFIEASDGVYTCYNDLLPNKSAKGALSDFVFLDVSDGTLDRKWAIVGVYHAFGFQEKYLSESFEYNDSVFGAIMNSFGAPFLIAYDSGFVPKYENGMTMSVMSKQYSIQSKCEYVAKADDNGVSRFTFMSLRDGKAQDLADYTNLRGDYFLDRDLPPLFTVFCYLAILSAVGFYLCARSIEFEKPLPYLCWTVLPPFLFGLFGSVLSNNLGGLSPFFYSCFSYYFGVSVLVILAIASCLFLRRIKDKKKVGYENQDNKD